MRKYHIKISNKHQTIKSNNTNNKQYLQDKQMKKSDIYDVSTHYLFSF